jgi:GTP-binding protein EngB required for normal cell division
VSALERRLGALAEAVEVGGGRLDVAPARALVDRAGERLGHGLDATVVALAGPTGAGKSTLFNVLAGRDLVSAGVRRPTTAQATAAVWGAPRDGLLDWLAIPRRHALTGSGPDGLVLLDLPDFDSVESTHRTEAERLVALVDLLVWVTDPQKYADAALHDRYLRPLAAHAPAMLVVLNQADRLGDGAETARADLAALLAREGLPGVPVLAVSALTGAGVDALRRALADRVKRREAALARLGADAERVAAQLRTRTGERDAPGADRRARGELVGALATAAAIPAVVHAVDRAHRRRGALAVGIPWVAWLRRLRPDPLRRLGLGDHPQEEVRTSLPQATPVQRAQVDSAARSTAATASAGLPDPWPGLARAAATRREAEVAERLDRAVAGADLGMRRPRWWTPARRVQQLLALVTLAGALWLLALVGVGFLRLEDVVPTPEVEGIPLPTALLLGGLLASLVLALGFRLLNRLGARRRAGRARRELHGRVEAVGAELILAPLAAELGAHDRLRRLLR